MSTYKTEAEVTAVLNGFETCTTDKAAFKHQDHLTVAVCYLRESTVEGAAEKLRTSLLRFVDHHKVDRQKYNETITVFWLEVVADLLKKMHPAVSLVEQCNAVVEAFNDAKLISEYYSTELLFSDTAREQFVGPDLKDWRES